MKALLLLGLAVCVTSTPAFAARIIQDKEATAACAEAATDLRDGLGGIMDCSRALSWEVTTGGGHRVATFVNRGILYIARGDVDRAVSDFDSALALDSTAAEAWLGKSIVYARKGDLVNARDSATRAIDNGTNRPALAYFIRGLANESQGNLQAAHSDMRMALRHAPKWSDARSELARYEGRSR